VRRRCCVVAVARFAADAYRVPHAYSVCKMLGSGAGGRVRACVRGGHRCSVVRAVCGVQVRCV